MRRGGFGALLAFTVAVLMLNGQSGSTSGSSNSSSSSPASSSSLSSKAAGSASSERGICPLQPNKLSGEHPCGLCSGFCAADDLQDTIESFFLRPGNAPPDASKYPSCQLPSPPNRKASDNDPGLKSHWNVPFEARGSLRFVIATMPDPSHTHLTLNFDRQITATIEAAQQQKYLLARSYLPWDLSQHAESTSLATRMTAADWQSQKESLPGLLIFRKALPGDPCDAAKVLFVFIVGESPTAGINKQQFLSAQQIMTAIRTGANEDTSVSPLLILGPNFSGSLYSLQYLLDDDADTRPVIIHSGTASSSATIQWFQTRSRKRTVVFRSFVESDQYELQRFLAFAEGHGYEEKEIALLSEDETAYGNQSNPDASLSRMPHFYFPRDISHLRSAYQQQIQSAAASNSGNAPARSTLPLNLVDSGTDDDSVPVYSPGQTPLSEEAVLQGIVSNLEKHHSVFVVLQATSPLDTLFLTRYLRHAYPEGRIVTMGADSLLSREVDDPRFPGILSLTSYPLLPAIDDIMPRINTPSGPAHIDLVFPWTFSVGAFNAMVALLHDPAPLLSCSPAVSWCQDLPAAPYAEYGWPSTMSASCPSCNTILAPPLWLTVIGSNGYWPLAVLDAGPESSSATGAPSQIHAVDDSCGAFSRISPPPHTPHPWKMLCVVFLAVVILYLFFRYRGSVFAISKVAANFAPVDDSYCNYSLLVADVVLFGIAFLLLAPWRYASSELSDWPLHLSLWAILILLAIVSVLDFLKRVSYWLPLLSLVSLIFFLWISTHLSRSSPSTFRSLSFYRYVHISSGVSPFLPFLILSIAGVWWAWYTLAGMVLTDKRGPRLPTLANLVDPAATDNSKTITAIRFASLTFEKNRDLRHAARPGNMDHRIIFPPILAFSLSLFIIDFAHPVRSLEGGGFDRSYATAFGVTLFILLCELFRLVVVWIELRRPLAALDRLTLRRGFLRLEELRGKPIWSLGGSAFDDFFPLVTREFDALRNLRKFLIEERVGEEKDTLTLAIIRVENAADAITKTVAALKQKKTGKNKITSWQRVQSIFDSLKQLSATVLRSKVTDFLATLKALPSKVFGFRAIFNILRSKLNEFRKKLKENAEDLKKSEDCKNRSPIRRYVKAFSELVMPNQTATLLPRLLELHESLADACAKSLLFLSPRWDAETAVPQIRPEPAEPVSEFRLMKTSLPQSTQIAEDFVCLFYFNFISSIFLRLRTLLMSVAGMFVFLVLSFNSYPFEPQTSAQTLMVFVFILIVSLVAFVLGQMSRDATLSHITNTTPGQLGWEFWLRLASFVAIPLLSLLSAQFPQIGGFLFSWAQPALNTLK